MSRYTDAFNTHAYRVSFEQLRTIAEETRLGDLSQTSFVQEILRFKKVVKYLDETLNSLDPELVPLSIWDSFHQYSTQAYSEALAFSNNRNIGHLRNANTFVDNLLNLARPYMIVKGKAKQVNENLFAILQSNLQSYLTEFQERAEEKLSSLESNSINAQKLLEGVVSEKTKIEGASAEVLGNENEPGLLSLAKDAYKEIVSQKDEIEDLHTVLVTGTTKTLSIKDETLAAKVEIEESKAKVSAIKSEVTNDVSDLKAFYIKIFGKLNDDEERVGGLSFEVDSLLSRLRLLEEANKLRYQTIIDNIESLVPAATSAGLAKSYQDMKDSFDTPIKNASRLFYVSIGLIVIFSYLSMVTFDFNFTEHHYSYQIVTYNSFDELFRHNVYKFPLWVSLIWLTVFASKRRSECQRLQQEYAHKEAFAASYIKL